MWGQIIEEPGPTIAIAETLTVLWSANMGIVRFSRNKWFSVLGHALKTKVVRLVLRIPNLTLKVHSDVLTSVPHA